MVFCIRKSHVFIVLALAVFVLAASLANLGATGEMNDYMRIPPIFAGDERHGNPSLSQSSRTPKLSSGGLLGRILWETEN